MTSWLIVIIIIAGVFRFAGLGAKSLWFDEATSFCIARASFSSVWHDLSSPQLNNSVTSLYTALYYAFLHFWIRFGQSEFWLRLPSALCGLATVPLLYAVGSRLFDKQVGLAAAFLLAVQPVHVAYSQEARSYALCVFLSVAAFYFLIRAVQQGTTKWWLLYVGSMVLAIYSHLFAVFLLPAQCLALLFLPNKKAQLRPAIVSTVMIGLLILPVFWLAMARDPGKIPWGIPPGVRDILHAVETLTGAGLKFPVYLAVLGMAGASFYRAVRDTAKPDLRWRHALLWSWLLIPVVSIVLAALWKPPLFPRYLIFSLPASTLLAAVGLCSLRSPTRITAATLALGVLFVPAIFNYYRKPKEDWRGAMGYLLTRARPEDGVVFYQVYGEFPFDYYCERMGHASAGPPLMGPLVALPGQAAPVYRMPTIWLVVYGVHANDPAEAAWLQKTETSLEVGHDLVSRHKFHEIEILCYTVKKAEGSPAETTLIPRRTRGKRQRSSREASSTPRISRIGRFGQLQSGIKVVPKSGFLCIMGPSW